LHSKGTLKRHSPLEGLVNVSKYFGYDFQKKNNVSCSVQTASSKPFVHGRLAASPLKLADADVLIFYTFALFAVGGIERFLDAYSQGVQTAVTSLFALNAGELLAFIAIYSVLKSKIHGVVLVRQDFAIISACAALFLVPKASLPFVGATIAGLYFWRLRAYNPQLASAGQLWLAISFYETWGRVFFKVISAPLIQIEVFVVAKAGEWIGAGLRLDGIRIYAPSGWFVYILEGCSSFHNSSLAVLIWLSLIKLAEAKITGSKLMALGAGILTIVCLNVTRILLMTSSEEAYHFWHEGIGATLFSCLTLGAITIPTAISLRLRRS
jgi:exosortase/archaeosortase family protein